jgi:hypothetical protein
MQNLRSYFNRTPTVNTQLGTPATVQFSNGHALVIGVGADLPNTVQDANGIAAILRDPTRCGYPVRQVLELTAERTSRTNLLSSFTGFSKSTTVDSTAVIYFSGHGYRVSGEYFWLPFGYDLKQLETTAISGREFSDFLNSITAKKLLVLLDCCHAGGLESAKLPGRAVEKAPVPLSSDVLDRGRGRVWIASSQANEISLAGRPYSAFTLALIEALSGQGNARQDGYVRIADLAGYAREIVPRRTRNRQHPILSFEEANNFEVAYYAAGAKESKGVPFDQEPEIEIEPGNWARVINYQPNWQVGQLNRAERDQHITIGSVGTIGFSQPDRKPTKD